MFAPVRRAWYASLARYFVNGLVVVAPIAVTITAVSWTFRKVDSWINVEPLLNRRVPGAGIFLTWLIIMLTGVLASNYATRWIFAWLEDLLGRMPLVKLIYSSLKELVGAFVGEKKKFDRPVLIALSPDSDISSFGFVTRDALAEVGLPGHVAVYVPQAYNIGGNVVVVPRERVRALDADPAVVMTFLVSGGVTGEVGKRR